MASTLENRVGRYVVDRMCDKLHAVSSDAIENGISPREVVALLQEAWGVYLHDKTKRDSREFDAILKEEAPHG